MKPEKVIAGKYVLIVDDEQDVLDTLVDYLDMCRLDTASSFNEAKKLLKENPYDIAVFLADVFQAVDEGKSPWARMLDRLGRFYDKRFHGTAWREQEKGFLNEKLAHLKVYSPK